MYFRFMTLRNNFNDTGHKLEKCYYLQMNSPSKKTKILNTIAAAVMACIVLSFIVVSCWGSPPTEPQFKTGELTITRGAQSIQHLAVEIAETAREMEYGLMFRQTMPPDHGMIFLFPYPQHIQMWMKNTILPLDMVFFDENQKIVAIAANAKPQDETIISPDAEAKYVLEINAGLAAKWGLQNGDTFKLTPQ